MKPSDALTAIAKRLRRPGLGEAIGNSVSMGDHAALRRMPPLSPGPAARVAYALLVEAGITLDNDEQVRRWCVLVHSLALAHGAHHAGRHIGDTLVAMGFSEARLAQLLSADFDLLAALIPRLARRLHASADAGGMDFKPLMDLLLAAGRDVDAFERARLHIAKSFVAATHHANKQRKAS